MVQSGLARYATTGDGDVKPLSGCAGFDSELEVYRVIFDEDAADDSGDLYRKSARQRPTGAIEDG